jgi:hypothetical protein
MNTCANLAYNSHRMNTYDLLDLKLFGMNTCKKCRGVGRLLFPWMLAERFRAGTRRATVGSAIRDIIYVRILTWGSF